MSRRFADVNMNYKKYLFLKEKANIDPAESKPT